MTSSNFLADSRQVIVADTSVLINLNATTYAVEILRALPGSFVVTDRVLAELAKGARRGHTDLELVGILVDAEVASVQQLGDAGSVLYRSLVDGSAQDTLDDGEAATIAYARQISGVALIDERKARSICVARFADLLVASTVDLLTHESVSAALGRRGQIRAIRNALREARMRVPPHQLGTIVDLIGRSDATQYESLPRRLRTQS